jgi:pilus assembly protein Flp/PilA
MKVIAHIQAFFKDEEGASGIEYALIAAMVAVVIAGASPAVKTAVKGVFDTVTAALKTA